MLGCSTASFYGQLPTEESINQIRDWGFPLCEVFLNTFSEYESDFVQQLKHRIDQNGLLVNSVHALPTEFEPQLFAHVKRQREDAFALLNRMMGICQILGAQIYVMHGKAMIHLGSDPIKAFDSYLEGFARIVEAGRRHGVFIALENVHWCMCNSPQFVRMVRKAVPEMCFTLDVKQAVMSGFSPQSYIEAMGEKLINVHVCDCKNGRPCLPGEGELDFKAVLQALQAIHYQGNVIFEIYHRKEDTAEQVQRSIAYCRQLFS